jgi:hypothetical protein
LESVKPIDLRIEEVLAFGYIQLYIHFMPIHQRVLEASLRICRERGKWVFGPGEIVAALVDLNAGSVRTHIMSRCCINAPAHHAHRWPYFRRLRRGVYEILPAWRQVTGASKVARRSGRNRSPAGAGIVVEVQESGPGYTAEIQGRPGKFRGASLDEVAALARATARKAGRESPDAPDHVQLRVALAPEGPDPVIEAYAKDIDRTLIRRSLRMGFEERLLALENWMNAMEQIKGAARRPRRGGAK